MNKKLYLLLMFWLCWQIKSIAMPISVFNFDQIVESSELVCVCSVLKVTLENPRQDKDGIFEAQCEVLSRFKGQSADQITVVSYILMNTRPYNLGFGSLKEGDVAVVFLKQEKGQNIYSFANMHHPRITLGKYYAQQDTRTWTIRKRVRAQLLSALDSETPEQVVAALFWLREMGETVKRDKLYELARAEHLSTKIAALRSLVSQKDMVGIKKASAFLLVPSPMDDVIRQQFVDLVWSLADNSVPTILANQLAASKDITVSRVGFDLLMNVGDKSSIPVLIHSLDSENRDVHMSAIVALSRITGKKGPSAREFMQNPDSEKEKWRKWWRKEAENYKSE